MITMMKLERVRQHLGSILMVNLERATVDALTEAISELDDLIVSEARAMNYAKDNPPSDLSQHLWDTAVAMTRVQTGVRS